MAEHRAQLTLFLLCATFGLFGCDGDSNNNSNKKFYDTQVYPTGDPASDMQNLQSAIASGGVVYLRAKEKNGSEKAFNLGSQVLQIEASVELVGEVGGDQWTGEGMTQIENGRLESHIPGTEITIRDLHFVNSVNGAIDFRAGHNITITGNRVTADTMQGQGIHDVVILPLQTVAINVGGELYADPLGHQHTYADVTGTVTISDNFANTEEAGVPLTWPAEKRPILNDVDAAYSYRPTAETVPRWVAWREVAWHTRHFQVLGAAADVVMRGNRSVDSPGIGIMMINGHGTIEISENEVTLSKASDYYFGSASAGIGFFDSDVSGEHASEKSVDIRSNLITTQGIFQCGVAFYDYIIQAQQFGITNNEVRLSATEEVNPLGCGYYGGNITLELSDNSVSGVGTGGIFLYGELAGHASNNDFSGLESSVGNFVVRGEVLPESIYSDLDLSSI